MSNAPEFIAYYRANTPAALEWGNDRTCCACSRELSHVMMTTAGAMGRECYATATGDHGTRHMLEQLSAHGGDQTLAVFHRLPSGAAWLRVRTFAAGSKQSLIRFRPGTVAEAALVWWADTHAAETRTTDAAPKR